MYICPRKRTIHLVHKEKNYGGIGSPGPKSYWRRESKQGMKGYEDREETIGEWNGFGNVRLGPM